MRIISLTMPLYAGMGYGNLSFLETPFKLQIIGSRVKREVFTIGGESGTRRQTLRTGTIENSDVVLQDTAIVDVGPKGHEEEVTPEDVERGMAKADFREGDAVIFRTGWGDNESYRKLGIDYEFLSPHFGDDPTWIKIAEIMKAQKSKLFCHDTANCLNMKKRYKKWLESKTPRPRPWPSPEAKAWIKKWETDLSLAPLTEGEKGRHLNRLGEMGVTVIGALVNCGAIQKKRVKLIALPLKVEGVKHAPCNVVAIEE